MYKRILFSDELPSTSCFVLGPRQTGKTSLLNTIPVSIKYDLLLRTEFLRLNRNPDLIYKEASKLDQNQSHFIWIDEVQKIPSCLDLVQKTIDQYKNINFLLSGSSARKLKKFGINLLGGRALDYKFHPLTISELANDFELDTAMRYGTLPHIYTLLKENKEKLAIDLLYSYVSTYLAEEIKSEALVRDLEPFQRFLEVAAQTSANLVNFSKIADDSGISHTATTNYYSILEDTLIGFFLPAYHASVRKQLIKQPKFYFFDNGVNRAILNTLSAPLQGLEKGNMHEQFVIQEIRRVNDYYKKRFNLYFWRTLNGSEVDLLICRGTNILMAIECKASKTINLRDLSGLKAFKKDYPKVQTVICAPIERKQEVDKGYTAMSLDQLISIIKDL
jgi:predicted AAA+ superfamily ATPase